MFTVAVIFSFVAVFLSAGPVWGQSGGDCQFNHKIDPYFFGAGSVVACQGNLSDPVGLSCTIPDGENAYIRLCSQIAISYYTYPDATTSTVNVPEAGASFTGQIKLTCNAGNLTADATGPGSPLAQLPVANVHTVKQFQKTCCLRSDIPNYGPGVTIRHTTNIDPELSHQFLFGCFKPTATQMQDRDTLCPANAPAAFPESLYISCVGYNGLSASESPGTIGVWQQLFPACLNVALPVTTGKCVQFHNIDRPGGLIPPGPVDNVMSMSDCCQMCGNYNRDNGTKVCKAWAHTSGDIPDGGAAWMRNKCWMKSYVPPEYPTFWDGKTKGWGGKTFQDIRPYLWSGLEEDTDREIVCDTDKHLSCRSWCDDYTQCDDGTDESSCGQQPENVCKLSISSGDMSEFTFDPALTCDANGDCTMQDGAEFELLARSSCPSPFFFSYSSPSTIQTDDSVAPVLITESCYDFKDYVTADNLKVICQNKVISFSKTHVGAYGNIGGEYQISNPPENVTFTGITLLKCGLCQ